MDVYFPYKAQLARAIPESAVSQSNQLKILHMLEKHILGWPILVSCSLIWDWCILSLAATFFSVLSAFGPVPPALMPHSDSCSSSCPGPLRYSTLTTGMFSFLMLLYALYTDNLNSLIVTHEGSLTSREAFVFFKERFMSRSNSPVGR